MDTKRPNFSEDEWEQWLNQLGLTSRKLQFQIAKNKRSAKKKAIPIEIHKVRPAYRVGNQGLILEQVIVSITQSITIKVNSGGTKPQEIRFRGGSTIIFDSSKDFSLSYIITKNIRSQERFQAQSDYQQGDSTQDYSFTDSMYEENTALRPINFAHLHFH